MVLQYKINNNNRNMTLASRLIVYEKINKILTTDLNKNKCIEYDKNLDKLRLNNIVLEKRIGSPSFVGMIMLGNIKKNKLIREKYLLPFIKNNQRLNLIKTMLTMNNNNLFGIFHNLTHNYNDSYDSYKYNVN